MADKPWSGKTLSRGQVVQRLESIGCTRVREVRPGTEVWRSPTGRHFTISFSEINAEFLEGMITKIEEWVEQAPKNRD